MQITLSIIRNSTLGTEDNVNVTVDNLVASAPEIPFVDRLVANVTEFARSQLATPPKEKPHA